MHCGQIITLPANRIEDLTHLSTLSKLQECQKIIRLKSLDAKSDVATVAKEVLDKCKLIHQSKLTEEWSLMSHITLFSSNFALFFEKIEPLYSRTD